MSLNVQVCFFSCSCCSAPCRRPEALHLAGCLPGQPVGQLAVCLRLREPQVGLSWLLWSRASQGSHSSQRSRRQASPASQRSLSSVGLSGFSWPGCCLLETPVSFLCVAGPVTWTHRFLKT